MPRATELARRQWEISHQDTLQNNPETAPDFRFPTKTVGSFPGSVEDAISVQAECGIHYPTTGQSIIKKYHGDMEAPFLAAFDGIKIKEKQIKDKVLSEITIDPDRLDIRSNLAASDIVAEVKLASSHIAKIAYPNFIGLIAGVCGPNTLFDRLPLDDPKNDQKKDILRRLSQGLVEIIGHMLDAGASAVQIDEPVLWNQPVDELAVGSLEDLFSDIESKFPFPRMGFLALHACGELSSEWFEELAKLPNLDLLDMEFARWPENFNVVNKRVLQQHDINIGVGVVSKYREDGIETSQKIQTTVNKMLASFDSDSIFLKPDCSLRFFDSNDAPKKLQLVRDARTYALNHPRTLPGSSKGNP